MVVYNVKRSTLQEFLLNLSLTRNQILSSYYCKDALIQEIQTMRTVCEHQELDETRNKCEHNYMWEYYPTPKKNIWVSRKANPLVQRPSKYKHIEYFSFHLSTLVESEKVHKHDKAANTRLKKDDINWGPLMKVNQDNSTITSKATYPTYSFQLAIESSRCIACNPWC